MITKQQSRKLKELIVTLVDLEVNKCAADDEQYTYEWRSAVKARVARELPAVKKQLDEYVSSLTEKS